MTTGRGLVNYPEWNELHPSQPLRQGDVLVDLTSTLDPWRKLLIVLTADCDLAREKHSGALSCVPLLEHTEYLLNFRFDRMRGPICDKLTTRLLDAYQKSTSNPAIISEGRMREWIVETDTATIIDALTLDGEAAPQFRDTADVLRALLCSTPSTISSATDMLAKAKYALGEGKSEERCFTQIAGDFASTLRSLPGDALFLNELSPAHQDGYIAYLRRIVEVEEKSVVTTPSRLPHDARYLRVSRLRSPYVYAVSHQFASVFAAIGLPNEYESARDQAISRLKGMGTST